MGSFRAALALLLGLGCLPALACECMAPGLPEAEFEEAESVFIARLARTRDVLRVGETAVEVDAFAVEVEKIWKGSPPQRFTIKPMGMCDRRDFDTAQPYLLYSARSTDGTPLLSRCDRGRPMDQARIEARVLDLLSAGENTEVIASDLPRLLLEDIDPLMRAEAARLLGERIERDYTQAIQQGRPPPPPLAFHEAARDAFVRATGDPVPHVRAAVAQELIHYRYRADEGVQRALFDTLLGLLPDADLALRTQAAWGLAQIAQRDSRAFGALAAALAATRAEPAADAVQREVAMHQLAVALTESAATADEKILAHDEVLSLLEAIDDPYRQGSLVGQLTLVGLDTVKATPVLLDLLASNQAPFVREMVIRTLAQQANPLLVHDIEPMLADPQCSVSAAALLALKKLDPRRFPAFFRERGAPLVQTRFDHCAHEFASALLELQVTVPDLQPRIQARLARTHEYEPARQSLQALLDAWEAR